MTNIYKGPTVKISTNESSFNFTEINKLFFILLKAFFFFPLCENMCIDSTQETLGQMTQNLVY